MSKLCPPDSRAGLVEPGHAGDAHCWGPLEGRRFEGRVSLIYYSYDYYSYDRGSLEPMPALTTIRWGRIFDRIR